MVRFRFHLDFHAFLFFWTNSAGNPGATGHACDRVYSVLRRLRWRMRGEWNVVAGALAVVTAPSVTIHDRETYSPIAPAADTPIEVRAPTGLNLLGRDARA